MRELINFLKWLDKIYKANGKDLKIDYETFLILIKKFKDYE